MPAVSGADVYAVNCTPCHSGSGEGGTGADLRQSTLNLAEITAIIFEGLGKLMPPWGDVLTPEEIEAVAAYVKGLQN